MRKKLTIFATLLVAIAFGFGIKALGWTSADPATLEDGTYYIYNVGQEQFLHQGNNWGTHATLFPHAYACKVVKNSDGTLKIQPLDGTKWLGADAYMDNATAANITATAVEGGYKLTNGSNVLTADGNSVNWVENASGVNATWQILTAAEMKSGFASVTANKPVDATFLIKGPRLLRENSEWQNSWTNNPNTGNKVDYDGSNFYSCAEVWNNSVSTTQEVDLVKGAYKLTVDGFYRYGGKAEAIAAHNDGTEVLNAYVMAGEAKIPLMSICDGKGITDLNNIVNDQSAAAKALFNGMYVNNLYFRVEADGPVTIGIKKDEKVNNDWTVFNNFTLTYYGPDATVEEITPKPADMTALKAACEAARAKLGFEVGECAPYNNVASMEALIEAEDFAKGECFDQALVDAKVAALAALEWTANEARLNAVYDGEFHLAANDGAPAGWRQTNNTIGGSLHSRAFVLTEGMTNYEQLAAFQPEAGVRGALFLRFDGTNSDRGSIYIYGQGTNTSNPSAYCMPLKAGVPYNFNADIAGWGSTGRNFKVYVTDATGATVGEQTIAPTSDCSKVGGTVNHVAFEFTPNADGNCLIHVQCPGGDAGKNILVSNFSILRGKQDQAITWEQDLDNAKEGVAIELTATASSELPVTYAFEDAEAAAAIATIDGNKLTFNAAGTVTVIASQEGNDDWNAAEPVSKTITAIPLTVCDNIAALAELTEEQAMNVKLNLNNAKVTYYVSSFGAYFVEDATGATMLAAFDEQGDPAEVEGLAQGKAVTGNAIGEYAEGMLGCYAANVDIASSEAVDVTYGAEMTVAEALNPANANKLVTFVASDDVTITVDEGMVMIAQVDDALYVMDPFYTFPEDYAYPENIEKVTGVIVNMGMAILAPRDPADIVAVGAEEEGVLWKSSNVDEESTADWRRVFNMTAEEAQEKIGVGDYLIVTVSYVDPEGGWPQVAVLPIEGWPPYINEGVSKESTCPFDVRFPVAGPLAKQMWENGFGVSGGDVRISKIKLEKATEELDPNTVWFGGKQCNWGNGISLNKDIFANAKAGDKVVINYAPGEATLQIMPGSDWQGLNIPIYDENQNFFVRDEAANQMIFTLQEDFNALEYADKTWDVFELLKTGGLTMHGPCYVNTILYIPATEPEPELTTIKPNTWYNLQLQDTAEPVLYLGAGWEGGNRQTLTLKLGEPGYEQTFKFVPVDGKEGYYNLIGLDGKVLYADGGWNFFWNDNATAENLASDAYQFTVEPQVGYILIKTKNEYVGSDGIWDWSKLYTDKGLDKAVKFIPVEVEVVVPEPEYTVYFDNSASQWETVYAYVWAGEANNAWPGQEMTKGENDVWSITFTEFEPENIIFNNGNGKQTEDLVFEDGKTYVGEAPASPKELYLLGTINGWQPTMKFETADEVVYTLTVAEAIPAETEFKIANADWSVAYTYDAAPIEPNVEYTFIDGNGGPGNAKIATDIPAGAKITFNAETLAFIIVAEIDGINSIDADADALFYNLQGVQVKAPQAGQTYIVVKNGRAYKAIVK